MKKLKSISFSILAILISIGFAACGGDSDADDTPKVLIENFSQGDLTFTEQSGEQSFSFTANSSWTITVSSNGGDTSWCTVYPSSGEKGTQTVRVSTTANTSYDDRNATITLTSGTQTKSFVVTQKQKNALLLTSDKFEIDKAGGTITVEVKSNVSYTATIGEECKDWIKEGSGTRGLTTTTKIYTISPSEETDKREGTITFTDGTLSETVHVYQTGGYSVVLNQRSYVIDEKGGSITVELRSNCDYDVILPDVDWIKEDKTRSMSSHTLYYNILANTTYDSREAIIIYKDKKDLVRDTLTVTQAQLNAVVLVDKSLSIGSVGGTVEAKVKSNVSYEVVMPDADWISRVPKTRGLTESVEQFTVKPNSGHDGRSAKIIFKTSDNKSDTLVVTQSQLDAIILTNKSVAIESNGATIDVKVMSNVNYEVKIPSDVDWVKVAPKTRGLAESTVQLVVSENKTYDSRSANIIFKSGDNVKDTLSITQAQLNAIIISNKNVDVESGGGTIDVKVQSNVDYSVEIPSSIDWITVAPKSRALTESTVQLIVGENSGDDSRSAEIIFKSKDGTKDTLNVTQAASIMVLTVKTLGTFTKLYNSSYVYPLWLRLKIIGPVYETELNGLGQRCKYCDLSEAIIYDANANKMDSIKAFISPIYYDFIETLILPSYMKSISDNAFKGRSNLKNIVLPNSLESIGTSAFENSSLVEISIPKGVTHVGENAFKDCESLTSASIYNQEVVNREFKRLKNLKDVYLSDNTTTIGSSAFAACEKISNLSIPNSVTQICYGAFSSCSSLEKITIPNSVKEIGEEAFSGCLNLTTVVLPNEITKIAYHTFSDCEKLESIIIPEKVESIERGAFWLCYNLSNVSLPNSLSVISSGAFGDCRKLREISIPCNIKEIGYEAFSNKINTCYIYAKTPPTHTENSISTDFANSKLYVPKGCLEAYSDWSSMFYNIYEMEE
jgi:hypothetical protein